MTCENSLRHVKICDFYGCEFTIRKHRKMHGMQTLPKFFEFLRDFLQHRKLKIFES